MGLIHRLIANFDLYKVLFGAISVAGVVVWDSALLVGSGEAVVQQDVAAAGCAGAAWSGVCDDLLLRAFGA